MELIPDVDAQAFPRQIGPACFDRPLPAAVSFQREGLAVIIQAQDRLVGTAEDVPLQDVFGSDRPGIGAPVHPGRQGIHVHPLVL